MMPTRLTHHCCAAIVAIAIGAHPIAAQDDPNTVLMKQLYTKIGQAVGVGENNPLTGETFLVLANPGILLDPSLDYRTPRGRFRFAQAIDKVLTASWIYGAGTNSVYDVYNNILQFKEPADIHANQVQIKEYKKYCKVIFTDCDQSLPGNVTAPGVEESRRAFGCVNHNRSWMRRS